MAGSPLRDICEMLGSVTDPKGSLLPAYYVPCSLRATAYYYTAHYLLGDGLRHRPG